MKPIFYTATYVAIMMALAGCGSKSSSTRTTMDTYPEERRTTMSDGTVVRSEATEPVPLRERTVSPVAPTTEDAAIATAVRERIADDRSIDSRFIDVRADRGTVYLNGSVTSPEQKMWAEQQARQVAGVTTVVNDLRTDRAAAAVPATDRRTCTLVLANPAVRTESAFGAVELRVYDDIGSPLYRGAARPSPYDEQRTYSERRAANERLADIESGRERPPVRPLDEQARVYDDRTRSEIDTPRVGTTGGRTQDVGSSQQAGTPAETGRTGLGSPSDLSARPYYEPPTNEERLRRSDAEVRLMNRGDLLWRGWLRPGEKLDITSTRGPIRYDYRFTADDWFHGNHGAWCSQGHQVIVP